MKKTFLVLMVSVLLFSCNLSEKETPDYVGTWERDTTYTYSGIIKDSFSTITITEDRFLMEIDHSFSGDEEAVTQEISDLGLPAGTTTYTFRLYGDLVAVGDILDVTWTEVDIIGEGLEDTGNTEPQSITYSVDGDTLSLIYNEGATPSLYTKK